MNGLRVVPTLVLVLMSLVVTMIVYLQGTQTLVRIPSSAGGKPHLWISLQAGNRKSVLRIGYLAYRGLANRIGGPKRSCFCS